MTLPRLSHTTRAVADAVSHYRQLRGLTLEDLSDALAEVDHRISADDLRWIEQGRTVITVDDLVAVAVVLEISPVVLLAHIPIEHPGEAPLATGVPGDVDQSELRAWMTGRTALDPQSRLSWALERVQSLLIASAHHEEQLQGAYAERRELGVLMVQEADAVPVQRLLDRIHDGERAVRDAELALTYAEHRLEALQGVER
ncbi:helix-turn-helix domain-containing protein [Curtobacterium sp. 1P10AnD]|uniref:helix-turn-helix domain-containing protein n=1 Tax=Curtobacterium sp. 1P10AnD TaxID=3132283 RepID=UPI0039A15B47